MKIAAVQFAINHDDPHSNWPRIEAFIKNAKSQDVDLIVFPEYLIGGPGPERAIGKEACERFCSLAKQYDLDIVSGTIVEIDPEDGKMYNCAYYIDNRGQVLLEYRKVHLWHPERDYLHQGKQGFGTVKNRFGVTVGMCVCWDIAFPEGFRHMVFKDGAQLVIAPAYWTLEDAGPIGQSHNHFSESVLLDSVVPARAFENEICMVFCNLADPKDEEQPKNPYGLSAGCTQIAVPFKGVIAHCTARTEEMIVADVDVEVLTRDAESVYKVREDWIKGKIFGGSPAYEVESIVKPSQQ
ncbi:carbon-nitrogen hydrolase [Lichtheimia hyalospora FSU 10163]|nr:carbon-nitrogen hydrolase [Lichtheimia hyalospora FSU 10163]